MKNQLWVIVLVLIPESLMCQGASRLGSGITGQLYPQGFYSPNLFHNASEIASLNPASLQEFKSPSLGITYNFDSVIDSMFYVDGIEGKRNITLLPVSAGFVYPAGSLVLGASFNKKYNFNVETTMPETTLEHPEGTGQYWEASRQIEIYDYSVMASYPFNLFPGGSPLSVGIKITASNLIFKDRMSNLTTSADTYTYGFTAGAEYESTLSEQSFIKFGLSYEMYGEYEKSILFGAGLTIREDPDPINSQFYSLVNESFTMRERVPEIVNLNIAYTINHEITLKQNFANIFWQNVSDEFSDQVESFSQIIYSPGNTTSWSGGVFFSDRKSSYWNYDYFIMLLSVGVQINSGSFNYGFSIFDSHIGSSKIREQTGAKIFLGYNL